MNLAAQLEAVRESIAAACVRSSRNSDSVTLIAVSKTHPADLVNAALRAGVRHIGENRVQEARDKFPALEQSVTRHLIGSLQSNKARLAVELFDVVQSVDSLKLAKELDRHAHALGRKVDVLIQVNIADEAQKGGATPSTVGDLANEILALDGLALKGLMTIPPIGSPEETRPWFVALRQLRDTLRDSLGADALPELSMGMTSDYEVAIEEGATMVRVGRGIFGARGAR